MAIMKQVILFGLFVLFTTISHVLTDDNHDCGGRKENPTRPCPENEITCVRTYFQNACRCRPEVPASDTLHLKFLRAVYPFFNLDIIQAPVKIGGLKSGKIVDFLVDYQTNLIVLTVDYVNVTIESQAVIHHYQTAQEPRRITTYTFEFYETLSITTVFFDATSPSVHHTYSVANVTAPQDYALGSCFTNSTDPVVQKLFKKFVENLNVASEEAFHTRSRIFAFDFIQKYLCNFGIALI